MEGGAQKVGGWEGKQMGGSCGQGFGGAMQNAVKKLLRLNSACAHARARRPSTKKGTCVRLPRFDLWTFHPADSCPYHLRYATLLT